MLKDKKILLIIGGGVAAYKALDLARRLMERGARVRGVLTNAGSEFITPMSVASLTGEPCFTDLFDLKNESEMGHIRLSREADLVLIAPATADLMAKMAQGLANDLATTLLLATDKPVMAAPAMNAQMWQHPATVRNRATLRADGIHFVPPGSGMLACGEVGPGRLAEVMDIVGHVEQFFAPSTGTFAASFGDQPLAGRKILVTAGPTQEPIDPVRFIANRSSGKQGFAIAGALSALGAEVVLVAGPVSLLTPDGVVRTDVETALEMQAAVTETLKTGPLDAAIFVAAVADWRIDGACIHKLKKSKDGLPELSFVENPDILKSVAHMTENRPGLVVGFAAETNDVLAHAEAKMARKGCDWLVANDVSGASGVMGGDRNKVHLFTSHGREDWPSMGKEEVAARLALRVAGALTASSTEAASTETGCPPQGCFVPDPQA